MEQEWSRMIWTNPTARAVWEPRIQAIQQAWARVEVQSVERGLRRTCLVFGNPETTLSYVRVAENRYACGPHASALASAYVRQDDETVGQLLGYPACCRDFFAHTWGTGARDTTGQMKGDGTGPVECNILGRWMGVRFAPHLPCSWSCLSTVDFAHRLLPLWPHQEREWALQVLNWPVEWTSVHGIAEIKFPVLKISASSAIGRWHPIRRPGTPPPEAASGISFPFQTPRRLLTFDAPSVNGFSSLSAMNAAHDMILQSLDQSPPQGLVLDLGCGNGHLLRRVAVHFETPILGIECDAVRAGTHPDILIADLREVHRFPTADTVLVSQRRFEEIPTLEDWCRTHARQVLVYSYDPPMFADVRKVA